MTDVHLTCSASGAGSLRQAMGRGAPIVTAEHFPDLGPLDDGRRRSRFLRDLLRAGSSERDWQRIEDFIPDDAFAPWTEVLAKIANRRPERLIVWVSGSGADYVYLRMTARFLADTGVPLWKVPVPPLGDLFGIGYHRPEHLGPLLDAAVPLDADACRRLGADFDAIAARPMARLRRLAETGRIEIDGPIGHPMSGFRVRLAAGASPALPPHA